MVGRPGDKALGEGKVKVQAFLTYFTPGYPLPQLNILAGPEHEVEVRGFVDVRMDAVGEWGEEEPGAFMAKGGIEPLILRRWGWGGVVLSWNSDKIELYTDSECQEPNKVVEDGASVAGSRQATFYPDEVVTDIWGVEWRGTLLWAKASQASTVLRDVHLRLWPVSGEAAPDLANVTIVGVELKSIEFSSDHEDENGANLLKKSPDDKYANVGAPYEEPEWQASGRNNPITHSKGENIMIRATVKGGPSGIWLKLKGDSSEDYADFESDWFTSTGADQELEMVADAKLPNEISCISDAISWKALVRSSAVQHDLGTSGPHEMLVTLDTPKEVATRYNNRLTYVRAKHMCETVANGDADEDTAAAHMHQWIKNNIPFQGPPDAWSEAAIWGLVDGVGKAQCHQGGNLMDFGMRQLGVDSTYEHIKASARLPVLFAAANPCSLEKRPDGTRNPPIPACPHGHGPETLLMLLDADWNEGEGSCRVGSKVYAAFLNAVGEDEGARTAEHHILILFQAIYGQDFQRWVRQGLVPCGDWEPVPQIP